MYRHVNSVNLTGKEIRLAARSTIYVLKRYGLTAYLVGSAACAIYGMKNRTPNDIDVVVITHHDQETIKRLLEKASSRFFTVPSTNPRNTYRVLWFANTPLVPHSTTTTRAFKCKVDILVPGILGIPVIPTERIVYTSQYQDIPVGPFLEVFLLKLKAWADHSTDHRSYMRAKIMTDYFDIKELLQLARKVHGIHLDKEAWLPDTFIQEAKVRVQRYITDWPLSKSEWKAVGF